MFSNLSVRLWYWHNNRTDIEARTDYHKFQLGESAAKYLLIWHNLPLTILFSNISKHDCWPKIMKECRATSADWTVKTVFQLEERLLTFWYKRLLLFRMTDIIAEIWYFRKKIQMNESKSQQLPWNHYYITKCFDMAIIHVNSTHKITNNSCFKFCRICLQKKIN